jgi:hypothetical protein
MVTELKNFRFSALAGESLASKQFRFVKLSGTDNTVVGASVDGEAVHGINQGDGASGEVVEVCQLGISYLEAGGTATAGGAVKTDSVGRGITHVAGNNLAGYWLESGVTGEIIKVLANCSALSPTGVQGAVEWWNFPIDVSKYNATGDIITDWTPGFAGSIQAVQLVNLDSNATSGRDMSFNLEIGTTNLSGGVVQLTSANSATAGVIVAGSAVTGNNTFGATSTISIECIGPTFFDGTHDIMLMVKVARTS